MATSSAPRDYYAVLQVQPNADFEVIEAAYRQLMKKHHPDRAGDDARRVAEHLERAKSINAAFSVLRDPEKRRRYDLERRFATTVPPATSETPRRPDPPRHATDTAVEIAQPDPLPWFLAPLALLSAAYYLLPGPYEWEPGHQRDLASVLLLPAFGVAGFALASGRFAPLIGHSLISTLVAWALLTVAALLALWGSVLRVAVAAVPTLALASGWLNPFLEQAHVPVWLAWALVTSLSLIFSARLYLFAVLPTLALIWLLARPA